MAKVALTFSESLIEVSNRLPRVKGRASIVHELIQSYQLLDNVNIIQPRVLTTDQLANFHSRDYLKTFKDLCDCDDPEKISKDVMDEYGLGYDCPVRPGLYDECSLIAGASVQAAEALVNGEAEVAINWCGGWHHAKRFEASGFCYINDIVLAAQKLREGFERVLYIDLDLHHGDGVEDAFYSTDRVFTLSIHKLSPGFFPGSGEMREIGEGRGEYHNLNVPLKDGISGEQYLNIFNHIFDPLIDTYNPQAIICQCGADGLARDEMDSFNLSSEAIVESVARILTAGKPTLLLGGGGYNFANTARCWTQITAVAMGIQLPSDIPEDSDNFMLYRPDFELPVLSGNRKDENKLEDVDLLIKQAKSCIVRLVDDNEYFENEDDGNISR